MTVITPEELKQLLDSGQLRVGPSPTAMDALDLEISMALGRSPECEIPAQLRDPPGTYDRFFDRTEPEPPPPGYDRDFDRGPPPPPERDFDRTV